MCIVQFMVVSCSKFVWVWIGHTEVVSFLSAGVKEVVCSSLISLLYF